MPSRLSATGPPAAHARFARPALAQGEGETAPGVDRLVGINDRILHFSPSWFSVTMGSGIPATLILSLPYANVASRLRPLATFFLIFDTILFLAFGLTLGVRYAKYPSIFQFTLFHPVQSMYLGTIPMSILTLISGTVLVTQSYGMGDGWVYAMSYCWWPTLALTAFVAVLVPFVAFTRQQNLLENSTAVLILPVVPAITCSAIGASIADHLLELSPTLAYHLWLGSYLLLGCGMPLAMGILALYLQRLLLHHIPSKELIVSSFLPLGPCGLGGFSLVKLGRVGLTLLPATIESGNPDYQLLGAGMYGGGVVGALLLWGLGMWFLLIALTSFLKRWREGALAFNMGWWGLTFPLASLTLSTLILGAELQSPGMQVIGTAFTICVILCWAIVTAFTVIGVLRGDRSVFAAPCLSKWAETISEKGTPRPIHVLS